jgi:hypothetical protein
LPGYGFADRRSLKMILNSIHAAPPTLDAYPTRTCLVGIQTLRRRDPGTLVSVARSPVAAVVAVAMMTMTAVKIFANSALVTD